MASAPGRQRSGEASFADDTPPVRAGSSGAGADARRRDQPTPSHEVVLRYQMAIEALPRPLTEEEAIALLDVFPQGEYGSLFELEWPLLHAIESAPYGRDLVAG